MSLLIIPQNISKFFLPCMPEIQFSIKSKNPAYYLSWKPYFGLVLFGQVMTKKWLENSVFGKISRIERVERNGELKLFYTHPYFLQNNFMIQKFPGKISRIERVEGNGELKLFYTHPYFLQNNFMIPEFCGIFFPLK